MKNHKFGKREKVRDFVIENWPAILVVICSIAIVLTDLIVIGY